MNRSYTSDRDIEAMVIEAIGDEWVGGYDVDAIVGEIMSHETTTYSRGEYTGPLLNDDAYDGADSPEFWEIVGKHEIDAERTGGEWDIKPVAEPEPAADAPAKRKRSASTKRAVAPAREKFDYPAVSGGAVTPRHTDYCAEHGHAVWTVDGEVAAICPRCGAVAETAELTAYERAELTAYERGTTHRFVESGVLVAVIDSRAEWAGERYVDVRYLSGAKAGRRGLFTPRSMFAFTEPVTSTITD